MAITQTQVGTSATTVYTSTNTTAITCMFFMNDNAAARTLTVHVDKNGASASTLNTICLLYTSDAADEP